MQETIYGASYIKARESRLKFARGKCEACKSKSRLQCHHASSEAYELDRRNKLTMYHVLILCEQCHDAITNVVRLRRYDGQDLLRKEETNGKFTLPNPFKGSQSSSDARQYLGEPTRTRKETTVRIDKEDTEDRCGLLGNPENRVRRGNLLVPPSRALPSDSELAKDAH